MEDTENADNTSNYITPVIIIVVLIIIYLSIRLYNYLTLGICKSERRLDGKTVIITGCTSGIGLETARNLAKRGPRLILACRNVEAATKLKDEFVKETGNTNIIVRKLDLASFKSIREFAGQINSEEERLDVLIHNAGIISFWKRKVTEDGLELCMETMTYGPFLLTLLLIDLLKRSAPARIVFVSSETYLFAWLPIDDPNPSIFYPAWSYAVSKYATTALSIELARRLQGTNVTSNTLHPGVIYTEIWKRSGWFMTIFTYLFVKPFCKNVVEGAQTTVYLAVSEEVEGVTGKHFMDCKVRRTFRSVDNRVKATKFWQICRNVTKMTPTDPQI